MNLLKTTALALRRLTTRPLSTFAGDSWKDRDEAAEVVFLKQKESTPISIQPSC
jgi:hypothetical protein